MIVIIHWPDGATTLYDMNDNYPDSINRFQAAMKTVAYLSQWHDVIIDAGVVTFVEKS